MGGDQRSGGGWRALDGRQRRVVTATVSANAMVFFDQTAIVLALPVIGTDFGATTAHLQWVITSYLLALAVLMLIAGRLADRIGLRRTFFAGLVIFATGSVLCAVSPSLPLLVAARFVQGIGAAVVLPLAWAITTRAVGEERRGWAFGILATWGTALLVFGPMIGGILLEASWRWIFVVSLPVVAFVLIRGRAIKTSLEAAPRAFSVQSVILLMIGLGALVVGLATGADLGAASVIPLLAGIGVLTLFVWHELRAQNPLIDVRLLRKPMLSSSLAALFANQFAIFAVTVYLALYLHHRLGLTGLAAGALIALAGIGSPLLSVRAGRIADTTGPRRLVLPGLVLESCALVVLGLLGPLGGVPVLLPGLIMFSVAGPAILVPASTGPFLALPTQRAFAASLATEARQLGAVLGVAATTAVGVVVHGASLVDGDTSVGKGFRAAMLVAAAMCALAALSTWRWMPAGKRVEAPAS